MKTTNALLVACALVISGLLLSVDYQKAFAYTITELGDGVDEVGGLAVVGNYVYTGTDVNTVRVYNKDNGALEQVVTGCTGCLSSAIVYNNRVYFFGTTTLYEVDRTSGGVFVISRSVTTTSQCYGNQYSLDTDTGILYCGRASTNDDIRGFDLDTMTMTYDSASLNAGGNPCNDPQFPLVNTVDGYYIVQCQSGTSVLNTYALQSETVIHSLLVASTGVGREASAFNVADDIFVYCPDFCDMFSYTIAGGFVTIEVNIVGTSSHGDTIEHDASGGRFILWSAGPEQLLGLDDTDADVLWTIQTPCTLGGNQNGVFQSSASIVYFSCGDNGGGNDFFYKLDMEGLGIGSGGSEPEEPNNNTGGFDCSLPANANILICRLSNEGGSLNGTGAFLTDSLGNVICNLGVVDCDANPDIRTNGIGYLFVAIALAVWVGIMWVAGRGDISSIPTFVWFIGTIVIVGAFTVMQYIDATFLVISVIAIVGFAVAKARNVFGGNNGGFTGEG